MTKKDYVKIAAAFKDVHDWLESANDEKSSAEGDFGGFDTWLRLQSQVESILRADSPRFDSERFNRACEV